MQQAFLAHMSPCRSRTSLHSYWRVADHSHDAFVAGPAIRAEEGRTALHTVSPHRRAGAKCIGMQTPLLIGYGAGLAVNSQQHEARFVIVKTVTHIPGVGEVLQDHNLQ